MKATQIRRVDWRFLLPTPSSGRFHHLVIVGANSTLADVSQRVGLAARVTRRLSRDDPADVIAVVGGKRPLAQLDEATRCLAPGGVVYVEVDRRPRSNVLLTPGRLARFLACRGLPISRAYWVKPALDAAEMYLPLEPGESMKWYLETLFTPITPIRRAARAILARVPAALFGMVVPSYALVAGQRPLVPAPVTEEQFGATADEPSVIMLTDNGERVVLLPLHDGRPRRAVKVAKQPEFGAKTTHEHDVLVQLHARLDPQLAASLPRPVSIGTHHGLVVAAESLVEGTSLLSLVGTWPFDRRRQVAMLREATAWLIRFHLATLDRRIAVTTREASQWLWPPLDEFRAAFGLTEAEERFDFHLGALIPSDADLALPLAWQHNDFTVGNVWRSSEGIRVIDWEGGRVGPVLTDLLYLVSTWHDTARGIRSVDEKLAGFRRVFIDARPVDPLAQAARAEVRRYCRSLGVSRQLVAPLLAVTWSRLAVGHRARSIALGESSGTGRSGNVAAAYFDLIAQHTDALTARWA